MLPMIQRSIFHLGEEGGGDGHRDADTHQHLGGQSHGRQERRGRDAYDVVVGLQILLQNHGRHPRPCHVVLKQMVSWPPARHRRPCVFLRACSLCRRDLCPNKDVYMYRGDQGFCSEECRRQQILSDEAREHEAMDKWERRGLPHHRHHHHGPWPTAAILRGTPRRLLVVA